MLRVEIRITEADFSLSFVKIISDEGLERVNGIKNSVIEVMYEAYERGLISVEDTYSGYYYDEYVGLVEFRCSSAYSACKILGIVIDLFGTEKIIHHCIFNINDEIKEDN